MIRPSKYLDLKTCVLHLASVILSELKQYRAVQLEELDLTIRHKLGEDARFNFLPALNFLLLAGSIDYDLESDTVFLLKKS